MPNSSITLYSSITLNPSIVEIQSKSFRLRGEGRLRFCSIGRQNLNHFFLDYPSDLLTKSVFLQMTTKEKRFRN